MSNISTEIEKLVCYCMDRSEITEEDIEAVCANWLTNRIFAMTDAIVEKNQKRAINLYYDLLALKEPPAKILALITRQFNLMLQVKEMNANHKDNGTIAGAVKLAPFLVGKYINWGKESWLVHNRIQQDPALWTRNGDDVETEFTFRWGDDDKSFNIRFSGDYYGIEK